MLQGGLHHRTSAPFGGTASTDLCSPVEVGYRGKGGRSDGNHERKVKKQDEAAGQRSQRGDSHPSNLTKGSPIAV